jgi:hypothetical protein
MATIHIPEAEAARNFTSLMASVRAGAEVVVEDDGATSVVWRAAEESPLRKLSESLRLARLHGSTARLDPGFSRDLEAVIAENSETLKDPWA